MKLKTYQIVAKTTCIAGWTVRAKNAHEARMLANGGPEWSNLDFDEPDDFEIKSIKEKKVEVTKL